MSILLLLLCIYFAPLTNNLLKNTFLLMLREPFSQYPLSTAHICTFVIFPIALGFQMDYYVLEFALPTATVQRVAAGHWLLAQKVFGK
jgi:hypothetical protein